MAKSLEAKQLKNLRSDFKRLLDDLSNLREAFSAFVGTISLDNVHHAMQMLIKLEDTIRRMAREYTDIYDTKGTKDTKQ